MNHRQPEYALEAAPLRYAVKRVPIDMEKALQVPGARYYYGRASLSEAELKAAALDYAEVDHFRYEFTSVRGGDILFFYSEEFYTATNAEIIKKAWQTAGRADMLCAVPLKKAKKRGAFARQKMKRLTESCAEHFAGQPLELWLYLCSVVRMQKCLPYVNRLKLGKYKLLVVFNDACPTENMMVQFFQAKGIKTATLQHGAYAVAQKEPKTLNESIVGLKSTIADCFLAWNHITVEQGKSFGIPEERFRVLGQPKYIGMLSPAVVASSDTGVFGVVLTGPGNEEENPALIAAANNIAEKFNLQYRLRYHPYMSTDTYNGLVDARFCLGPVPSSESVMHYADAVDFTIVGNSSVFTELAYLGKRVYYYRPPQGLDQFSDVDECGFYDVVQLEALLKAELPMSTALRRRIGGPADPQAAYRAFFSECISGFE